MCGSVQGCEGISVSNGRIQVPWEQNRQMLGQHALLRVQGQRHGLRGGGEVGCLSGRGQKALVWMGESLAKRSKPHPAGIQVFQTSQVFSPISELPSSRGGAGRAICPTPISLPKSSLSLGVDSRRVLRLETIHALHLHLLLPGRTQKYSSTF